MKDYSNETWQGASLTPACHNSPKLVFVVGNLHVYGARNSHVWRESWDLELPFLESPRKDYQPLVTAKMPDDMASHFPAWVTDVRPEANFIATVCQDGSVPPLTASWWQGLAEGLGSAAAAKTDGPYRVCAYCYGGHGRTGTALAILAWFCGVDTGGLETVSFVREVYCEEAVETEKQVTYIQKMTGQDMSSVDGSYAIWASKKKAAPSLNDKVTSITVDGETFDLIGGPRASDKQPSPRYNFSQTPYGNRAMGAAPPPGWDYLIEKSGVTRLVRLSRKHRKALEKVLATAGGKVMHQLPKGYDPQGGRVLKGNE